jgi:hypothetical protein
MDAEDYEDIKNVEAWAEVIGHLLYRVPEDRRAAVLALAIKNEEGKRKERETNGGLQYVDLAKNDTPGLRHWHTIMKLESLVVQMFVRRIRNNHSPKDAARILFASHRYGSGSGELRDYLDGLPGLPSG